MRTTRNLQILALPALALCALLTACGGGGAGSGNPLPPTASPTSSPTSNPGSTTAAFTGHVFQMGANDATTTTPIVGATVVISHTLYTGATPPPNSAVTSAGGCMATTAADGSYTCSGVSMSGTLGSNDGEGFVMVFAGSGYASLHGTVYPINPPQDEPAGYSGPTRFTTGSNAVRNLYLTPLDVTTQAWVSGIDSENGAYNPAAGANTSLVVDEDAVEAAVHWANYMNANGWFQHTCPTTDPACVTGQAYYQQMISAGQGSSENIGDGYATWQNFQSAVTGEAAACYPAVTFSDCPSGDPPSGAGHLRNQINPQNLWVGVAQSGVYYDTEFVATPTYTSPL